jgi:hypothetical protein
VRSAESLRAGERSYPPVRHEDCEVDPIARYEDAVHEQSEEENNWRIALLTYGEGWHYNHHAFQTSARHGLRWWEVDMTYMAIRVLWARGLVPSVKVPKLAGAKLPSSRPESSQRSYIRAPPCD